MNISHLRKSIEIQIKELQKVLNFRVINEAMDLFKNEYFIVLSKSDDSFHFQSVDDDLDIKLNIFQDEMDDELANTEAEIVILPEDEEWNSNNFACMMLMFMELKNATSDKLEYKQYTREGMIQRVLSERQLKAQHADYRIKWANNIYGDHVLTNEKGDKYKIFLRDFENETGYSNSKDSAVNKLGTTKHIMFAFQQLKNNSSLYKRLRKTCEFVEIYCDPLNDYAIRYFYPHYLEKHTKALLDKYFNAGGFVEAENLSKLTQFFSEADFFEDIVIRPEVKEKVNNYLEQKALNALLEKYTPDFSSINATLYDYQKEGIEFACCKKHAIIADEMGLGKTIQAIGIAMQKKELFGFTKTLVVCPASLKAQWKKEIEKFTEETAEIIQGTPKERALQYKNSTAFFLVINYETVLRDQVALNKAAIDFLILDEAQKVKNYATKTASAIKNVDRKHVLIITGTPIENKLIDLFSLMTILDPHLLGPLWEFSYQHCLFDHQKANKINAYYNLSQLKEQLRPVLLRREKRKVIEQLPNIQQQDIPVQLTSLQRDFHASYASGIRKIINKKFLTAFDMQRLQQLLMAMRMVCDSTYLVDNATNDSPKLDELKYILLEMLDLKNENRKVIIFSEWVKMHKLIGKMLLENNIGYCELNGNVPVKKRGDLIKQFEEDKNIKVFLSTEAGGAGLNLQVADILINFELPWNPAKKNQRIGRIDRLGQKSEKLNIFNLISTQSIEERIATGLLVKQNLFDSVLNEGFQSDFVDFTEKGRGQFLEQMKAMAGEFEDLPEETPEEEIATEEIEIREYTIDDFKKEHAEDYLIPFEEDAMPVNDVEINKEETEHIPEPQDAVETPPPHQANEKEPEKTEVEKNSNQSINTSPEKMEEVLNNGMKFLSGLMQMATGQETGIENQEIKVDKNTGEVTMKFKLPKF